MLCVALAAAPRAAAAPNPYDIYEGAEAFWLSQQYPPYLDYDVAVTVHEGGAVRTQRYASSYDATSGAIWVDPVSDYEEAHPHVPRGVNVSIVGFRIGKPEAPTDFIGVPILAPSYSFGMAPFVPASPPDSQPEAAAIVAQVRREFHDPYPKGRRALASAPSALPEIAHAVVTERTYTIALVNEEIVDGHLCYHLALAPTRDPGRYRLRELWVDERTGATWKLREALNFVEGPGTTVSWTVRFADIGGAQYIADESADAAMHYRGLIYTSVAVAFESVHPVDVPQEHPVYVAPTMDTLREP